MKYADWLVEVPPEITNDPIWKLEVYRLGLFAGDIGWEDVQFIANFIFLRQPSPRPKGNHP